MRIVSLRWAGIAILFMHVAMCVVSAGQDTVVPLIESITFTTSDVPLHAGIPFSLQLLDGESVLVTDSRKKTVSTTRLGISDGKANVLMWKTGTHPPPYASVIGKNKNVALVSYARSSRIDTVALSGEQVLVEAVIFTSAFNGVSQSHVIISDMSSPPDCSSVYALDGVHKVLWFATEGEKAIIISHLNELVEPTSIHLADDGSEIFITDWGAGSIWSLSLSTKGNNLTLLVGSGKQELMHDTAVGGGTTLSGPTQLATFTHGRILFTDRNPLLNTAAIRLLYTVGEHRGHVVTVAGGNSRAHVNGDSGETLFRACWGVTFNGMRNEILVSEPLHGTVRSVSSLNAKYAACGAGQYARNDGTALNGCVSCEQGSYCPGDNAMHACPNGLVSQKGTQSVAECWCDSGTMPASNLNSACTMCPANEYCPPFTNTSIQCPPHTSSSPGAGGIEQCTCPDGRYISDTECTLCPSGKYCANGVAHTCPVNAESFPGATSLFDCSCKSGFRVQSTSPLTCVMCTDGELCSTSAISMHSSVNLEVPQEIDLTEVLNPDIFQQEIYNELALPTDIVLGDVQVTFKLLSSEKAAADSGAGQQTQRRLLLALLVQRRTLLQTASDYAIWSVAVRVFLGVMNAQTASSFYTRLLALLEPTPLQQRILNASNGALRAADVTVLENTVVVTLSTSGTVSCNGTGEGVVSGECKCLAGYYGVPGPGRECTACLIGQFAAEAGMQTCLRCEDPNQTTKQKASTEQADCVCKDGFDENVDKKTGVRRPPHLPPFFLCIIAHVLHKEDVH